MKVNEISVNERKLFMEVFTHFQELYIHRNIELRGTLVYVNDECKFNIDGYNLLFNLKRLCAVLDKELK